MKTQNPPANFTLSYLGEVLREAGGGGIDRRYPLEQTAEAHRYVDGGHKKGKCSHNFGT